MPPAFQPLSWRARFLAALLAAHLLVIVAMAASPTFHEWIHQDAGQEEHECAVTLFHHGATDGPAALPIFVAAWVGYMVGAAGGSRGVWVRSAFLRGHVLEHAPPAWG